MGRRSRELRDLKVGCWSATWLVMRAGVASAGVDDASKSSAPMKSLYEQPEKPFGDVNG